MNFKKFIFLFSICLGTNSLYAITMDFELPLKIVAAKTEIESDYNYGSTKFLDMPIPIFGPVRVQYIFDNKNEIPWTFGAGFSSYFYPFQTIAISGSVSYRLLSFQNDASLEIKNSFDAGLFCLVSSYFDVAKSKTVVRPNFSLAAEYSLTLEYRKNNSMPFYFGLGPGIACAYAKGSFFVYYGINLNFGFRLITE